MPSSGHFEDLYRYSATRQFLYAEVCNYYLTDEWEDMRKRRSTNTANRCTLLYKKFDPLWLPEQRLSGSIFRICWAKKIEFKKKEGMQDLNHQGTRCGLLEVRMNVPHRASQLHKWLSPADARRLS